MLVGVAVRVTVGVELGVCEKRGVRVIVGVTVGLPIVNVTVGVAVTLGV